MLFSDQPNKRFSQMVPPPEFPFLKFWLQTTQKFQLTVKLLQGPDQVLGTCSGSIGEQNLTRLSMLILRQTLFLVMRNGFPPIGYWRSVSLWIYLATLTKALPQTLPFKDNVSLFAISGDGAVVTFTVTRPEVRNDDVRLKIDSDNFFFAIETFAKYLNWSDYPTSWRSGGCVQLGPWPVPVHHPVQAGHPPRHHGHRNFHSARRISAHTGH